MTVIAFIPPWVLSLFGLNEWSGIPKEEREKLEECYRRSLMGVGQLSKLVWSIPVLMPVCILLALVLG